MTSPAVRLVTIDAQIAFAERHLAFMLRSAPKRRDGPGARFVDRDLDAMRAIIETLKRAATVDVARDGLLK